MRSATRHPVPSHLAELPTTLITRTAELAREHVADALAVAGAREQHYVVLAALREVGATTPAQLARDTGLDRGEVTATLGLLCRRDLVDRTPDPADGRRTLVTLTTAGRRHLDRLDALLYRAQAALLDGLTNSDRARLLRLLTTVVSQDDVLNPARGAHPRTGPRNGARRP